MTLAALTVTPKIRILKFTSPTCGVCLNLQKKGFYEELKARFPSVAVESIDLAEDTAQKLADIYDVKSVPTFIFEVQHIGQIETIEGAGTKAESLRMFAKAIEACEAIATTLKETGAISW